MSYSDFIESKRIAIKPVGIDVDSSSLNTNLFPFQRDIVKWALKRGKSAVFAGTGLGKTLMQLEWANQIVKNTDGKVLIVTPLAVSSQTVNEGNKFGIESVYARNSDDCSKITITNYEMIDKFDPGKFNAVVIDESSILKSYTGAFRNELIDRFKNTPFKLACTATPAPNDFMELGNHSEFLNILTRTEMLATYFIHDGGETQKWRLKGHAQSLFWQWAAQWAVMLQHPSDLGYEDDRYTLPPLNINQITVETQNKSQFLFNMNASTLQDRIIARRNTVDDRVNQCVELVKEKGGKWILWCDRNDESEALKKAIPGSVEVTGSQTPEEKSQLLNDFANGKFDILITKPKIAAMGLNFQVCHQMAFIGLSDSWEQFYQAVRRCYRFGQDHPVDVYVVTADIEGEVVKNIERKEKEAQLMLKEMVSHISVHNDLNMAQNQKTIYNGRVEPVIPDWL
ncbi:MAG: DEAD/DEAH box helicase [Smithella sp.]